MGITIHYSGRLPEESGIAAIELLAREYASVFRWPVRSVDSDSMTGIVLYPHSDCEPFVLAFDESLEIDSFVKTQFAGAAVHIAIVDLLKKLAPCFETLDVHDEGEYWESQDRSKLEEHIARLDELIQNELVKYSGSRMKVHDRNGRIIDLQRRRTQPSGDGEQPGEPTKRPFWKRFIN